MKFLAFLLLLLTTLSSTLASDVERVRGATTSDHDTPVTVTRRLKGGSKYGETERIRDRRYFFYLRKDRTDAIIETESGYSFAVDLYRPGDVEVCFDEDE